MAELAKMESPKFHWELPGVDEDTRKFARKLFPDISDKLILQNILEIWTAMNEEKTCKECFGKEHCPLGSKAMVMVNTGIDSKNGWISWASKTCHRDPDWRYIITTDGFRKKGRE